MILLDNKGITEAIDKVYFKGAGIYQVNVADKAIVKATAKKIADAIDSMTADGWWLEDIVKAIRKEIE